MSEALVFLGLVFCAAVGLTCLAVVTAWAVPALVVWFREATDAE